MKGTVKFFRESSQFEFITTDSGPDIFFGRQSLPYAARIQPGATVEFETTTDRQGRLCAKTVKLISE